MDDLFRVGVISSTHGIAGEVKVFPTTDDVKRFDYLDECILDTGKEQITLHVKHAKYFKNMVILKFKEFNNINEIEKYKGASIMVTRENALKLEEDEYFIRDLIGLEVIDDTGKKLGTLVDVLQTGANDCYVVDIDGKEVLFPNTRECILSVDLENKKITVHVLNGLLDL